MLAIPVPMHIPDGFLSVIVSLVLWGISVIVIGFALKRVNTDLEERQIPLMGILGAAVFAGQMLNFSVTGGTSGHLLGAAIVTILLGPWPAMLVMTCVVGVQAIVFQDGGLLALGANLFNMAIVGVAVANFAQRFIQRLAGNRPWVTVVSGFASGWLSILIASLACGLQLALSGTSPANVAVPAMAAIHALIGIGEGLITAGALAFVASARSDRLTPEETPTSASRSLWVGGLALAVLLAVISPIASAHPDGLEWVAEQQGFLGRAQAPLYDLMPDYLLPGISNEALATVLAGIVGVGLVLIATVGVAMGRRRSSAT
ncbi:MAG: energy-coupling factor ABC transporter permease [Anaerolineae bacterium]|nr:energy-coupling factor ABC transporter permease [Anaerolineae bacterium]